MTVLSNCYVVCYDVPAISNTQYCVLFQAIVAGHSVEHIPVLLPLTAPGMSNFDMNSFFNTVCGHLHGHGK